MRFLRFAFAPLFILTLVSASALSQAPDGQSNGRSEIPDVYVAEGNSFVVSVPNLARVAVGNPGVISANVISPSEILIQGAQIGDPEDGRVNMGSSHLYVWSGSKRYVYRVVVIETEDRVALRDEGINRIVVEPNKVILYGITNDAAQTSLFVRGLRSSGVHFESALDDIGDVPRAQVIDDKTARRAIDRGIVVRGMTREQVIESRGEPIVEPDVEVVERDGQRVVVETLVYPDVMVRIEDGYVVDVRSHVGVLDGGDVESVDIGVSERTGMITRVYRLRHASPQEVATGIREFLTPQGTVATQDLQRLLIVEDAAENISRVDQIIRLMDTPRNDNGVSIIRTSIGGSDVAMIRLGRLLDDETKIAIAEEVQGMGERLAVSTGQALDVDATSDYILITGPPGLLDILTAFVTQNFIELSSDDIQRTIEAGGLIQGMTRPQAEAALEARPVRPARRVVTPSGVLWEYEYPNVILRFQDDRLFQILVPPSTRELVIARDNKVLYWGLTKSELDEITDEFGEFVRSSPSKFGPDGTTEIYRYDAGEAVFIGGRLEQFIPAPGSEFGVPGVLLPSGSGQGTIFSKLSAGERERMIQNGIIVSGMSLADVMRVYGSTPPSSVRVEVGDNGRVTWVYTYPGKTVRVVNGTVVGVTDTGQNEVVTQIVKVVSRRAVDIAPLVTNAFYSDPELAAAGISVALDESSNSLIVRDRLARINSVVEFVRNLDRETTKQVLIEARFVEVDKTVARNLGIEWAISAQSDAGNQPAAGFGGSDIPGDVQIEPGGTPISTAGNGLLFGILDATGFSFSGLRYTDIDIMIQALETSNDATVISAPRIMTLNNQPARIQDTRRVYDLFVTTTFTEFGEPINAVNAVEREVGIQLDVTPTIGEDGVISLDLAAVVSRVDGPAQQFGGNLINNIIEKTSTSQIMVRSGMPLVIGGLSIQNSTKRTNGVPFLSKIPIIGNLFKTDVTGVEDRELLIFLKARITPADGTMSEVEKIAKRPRPRVPNPTPTYATTPAPAEAAQQ